MIQMNSATRFTNKQNETKYIKFQNNTLENGIKLTVYQPNVANKCIDKTESIDCT